jgi:hypothetical protein
MRLRASSSVMMVMMMVVVVVVVVFHAAMMPAAVMASVVVASVHATMVHAATTVTASAPAVGTRDRRRQRNCRYGGQHDCKFLHYVPPGLKQSRKTSSSLSWGGWFCCDILADCLPGRANPSRAKPASFSVVPARP